MHLCHVSLSWVVVEVGIVKKESRGERERENDGLKRVGCVSKPTEK